MTLIKHRLHNGDVFLCSISTLWPFLFSAVTSQHNNEFILDPVESASSFSHAASFLAFQEC